MNVIICFDPFRGGSGFYGDNLNIIAVVNITDHYVLVALAGSHRELSPSSPCKVVLGRPGRRKQDGSSCPNLCQLLEHPQWLL
jgi:hypothetical protein